MTPEHTCLHERELGAMLASTDRLEKQLSDFLQAYNEESKSMAVALNSVVKMNEQTTELLSVLQNTLHGPNRDNGMVQTVLDTKSKVVELIDKCREMGGDARELKTDVVSLQKDFIKIAVAVSIAGALLANSIPFIFKTIARASGPSIEYPTHVRELGMKTVEYVD